MMMGVFSGVIDPRERDRILCDAVDRAGEDRPAG